MPLIEPLREPLFQRLHKLTDIVHAINKHLDWKESSTSLRPDSADSH